MTKSMFLKYCDVCGKFRSPIELWNGSSTPDTNTTTTNENRWNKQLEHSINIHYKKQMLE